MLKKLFRIGLVMVLGISVFLGGHNNLFVANALSFETSPISIPLTTAGDENILSVQETSKWTNADVTKGEVNVQIKSAASRGSELLKDQDIVFISDISGSMTGERTEQMKKALKQSATAFLAPELNNRIALASFDDRVSTDYNLGNHYDDFENAVDNIYKPGKGGGGTNYEAGLKQAYKIIKEQGEPGRSPVVIFMTDGTSTTVDGIDLYQKQIKSLGATIYTVQYMNGSTIAPILRQIATSDDYAFNAVKTSYITDIYDSIVNKVISSKSYKDIETKFEVRSANFDLKNISVDIGTVTKNGNIVTWKIPSLLSGATVNLIAKLNLVDMDASGYLLTHQQGTVSYGVSGETNTTKLQLDSTTLDRVMYDVKFDRNGATSGETPATYKAAATSMIDVPSNPNGLGQTGKVFLGWSISGTPGLVTGRTQMPNRDMTFKAEWGTPTISMNTDTIYSNITHLVDKDTFTSRLASFNNVVEIEFVDYVDSNATILLSVDGEEPIKAWVDSSNKLFIGSEGRIMAPTDCTNLFYSFKKAKTITFNGFFDTSEVTNMQGMFSGYNELTTLDVSSFNTSNVTDMSEMFKNQLSLTSLTLGNIDTSNVKSMESMFQNIKLTNITCNFNTTKVTNMKSMFADIPQCTEFDLSTFTWTNVLTSNGSGLASMFANVMSSGGNKIVWVQSEDVKTKLSDYLNQNFSERWPTLQVKPTTKSNVAVTAKQEGVPIITTAAKVGSDGLVDGGKTTLDSDINYKILVGFESTTASKSGVMKVTNRIPSDVNIDPASITMGAPAWDIADGSALAPTGSIYDANVEDGKLTFYVKDLSVNAKIDLTYKAKTPASLTGTYKEILNQSSLSIEDVNITSNYVRHFLGDDTTAPTPYKLSYQYDAPAPAGAPTVPTAHSYAEGQIVNIPKMSMTGYAFNGWKNGSTSVDTDTMAMPASDTVLIGSWTKVSIDSELKSSVTYEYTGDVPEDIEAPAMESYIVGSKKNGISHITERTITIPEVPTAEGYIFEGWTSTSLTSQEIAARSFQLGEKSVTLTGKWTKKTYAVTYSYADPAKVPVGAPTMPVQQRVTWGEHVTTESKFTDMSGYSFDGWYSDSNIDPDFQTGFEMPKEDVEIFAYWTEKPYTITYQYKGDKPSDAISLGTSKSVKDAPVSVWNVPESKETSKDGVPGAWTFNGWKSDQISSIIDGTFNMPALDVTLVGSWTFKPNPNMRSVTFQIENGRWADRTNASISLAVELIDGKATLPVDKVPTGMFANDGYTDGHWLVQPNTDVNGIIGDVTYTYKFVKKPIITFAIENGTWEDGTSKERTVALEMVNGKATLSAESVPSGMIANNGYTNGHWVVTPNTSVDGITQDITYTFVYDKIIDNGSSSTGGSTDSGAITDVTTNSKTSTGDTTQFLPQLVVLSISLIVTILMMYKVRKIKD